MPACTLSRAPLSCSTGRTRRSVVLASAPSHTPSHLCERPLAELAAERWPSAAAAALCARSTRRPFHAAKFLEGFGVLAVLRAAPFGRGPEGALQWANLHFSSRLAAPELAGGAQLRRPGALQENASSVKTNQQQRNATRAALFFQPAQPEAHAPRCLEPHTSLDRLPAPGWGGGVACRGGVRHQLRRRARVAREMAPPPPGEDL